MSATTENITHALNLAFLRRDRWLAQKTINALPTNELVELLEVMPVTEIIPVWDKLMLDKACNVIQRVGEASARHIMQRGDPLFTARVLARISLDERQRLMNFVDLQRQRELISLVQYPQDSAGSLMDQRFLSLTEDMTARDVLRKIRKTRPRFTRQLYTVDSDGLLQGMLEMHKLAFAEPLQTLREIQSKVDMLVQASSHFPLIVSCFL